MRNLNEPEIDRYRMKSPMITKIYGGIGDSSNGIFSFGTEENQIRIIASSGEGWDHVSVSLKDRCPTWDEMEAVKRKFFKDDETAMQLHVPPTDHINHHPYCLHLWRPIGGHIPRPPSWMVGPDKEA